MKHGGKRDGAGRKKGANNLLTQELRKKIQAEEIIEFLNDLALGDIKGSSIGERKDAAVALLRKVLPDVQKTEMEVSEFEPWDILGEVEKNANK